MKAYTLRIINSDNEDFLREVQILDDQTFLDLHDFLVEICNLQGNELSSFYICNSNWEKEEEISLIDMSIDEPEKDDDDDDDSYNIPLRIMEDTCISEVIKFPNQRMIYEFDFMNPIVLLIECVKITKTESDDYPICTISEGDLDEVFVKKQSENRSSSIYGDYDDDSFKDDYEDEELRDSDLMEEDFDDDGGYNSLTDGGIDDSF